MIALIQQILLRPRLLSQIKILETNLHICSQLIYDIGNIEVQWKEGELFNKLQLCGCMEKTNVNLYLVPDTIVLMWIRELNIKGKIMKFLEENKRLSS